MNKKSMKSLFSKTVLYLLLLLAVVLLYLLVFFPKFSQKINELDAQYANAKTQVDLLAPHEFNLGALQATKEALDAQFEQDTRLKQQVVFSDLIYAAADANDVSVKSLAISAAGDATLADAPETLLYSASVTLAGIHEPPAGFIQSLEANEGCGIYVTDFAFQKTNDAPGDACVITVSMYTKEKV